MDTNKENNVEDKMEVPSFVCAECGNKKTINSGELLKYIDYDEAWPECCGYTMIMGWD